MAMDETKPIAPQDPGKSRDERLAQVLARCADRLNAGQELKVEEILREHPDLAPELESALGTLRDFGSTFKAAPPPEVLGDYRIVGELGRGGMGIVYEAVQVSLGRRVALKILPPSLLPDARAVMRFQHEARVASRLDHPGICAVYGAGVEEGVPYIAMRYLEGETLAKRIEAERSSGSAAASTVCATPVGGEEPPAGEAPPESVAPPADRGQILERVHLIEKAARALHHAHEAGLIHRDIKPGNIMVTREGEPVILDFGLARAEEGGATALTLSGEMMGTPAYMSPEQIAAEKVAIDRRTDVYSLGVTLYELLTLKRPFEAPTREGLFQKILKSEPPDPRRLNRRVPRDLKVIIETALEKDLGRRYQTALDLAEDLRRLREREPILARPAGPVLRFRRWTQRNPVLATATLGLFTVLATGLAIALVLLDQVRTAQLGTEKALSKEKESRDTAEYQSFLANIIAAEQALLLKDPESLRRRLDAVPESRRKWEWGYLDGQADRSLRTFRGHADDVVSVSFSHDGRRILTASLDRTARIWDVTTGSEIAVLRRHVDQVHCASFSPDGTWVATGAGHPKNLVEVSTWQGDFTARLWDSATGEEKAVLKGHEAVITHLAFSPDGTRLVTVDEERLALVWDVPSARQVSRLGKRSSRHRDRVIALSFSPDGKMVATGSYDRTAKVWDVESGAEVATLGEPVPMPKDPFEGFGAVVPAFSPDGSRLAAGFFDGTVKVWSTKTWAEPRVLRGHKSDVIFVAFDPEGKRIISVSLDKTFRVWSGETGEELLAAEIPGASIHGMDFSREGGAAAGRNCIATGAGGRLIAAGLEDSSAGIWDLSTGKEVSTLRGHASSGSGFYFWSGGVLSVAFSPDGTRLLTGSNDRTAKLWDVRPGTGRTVLSGHAGEVTGLAFSPDGTRLASASMDGAVKIWDVDAGAEHATLTGHTSSINVFRWSPDGKRLVTGSADRTAKIWDVESGKEPAVLRGHAGIVLAAAFSPDGRRIATGAHLDPVVRLWDVESGAEVGTFKGHMPGTPFGMGIRAVSFSSDGTLLVTASLDRTARIWDVESAEELVALRGHGGPVHFASFTGDGAQVITASRDGTVRIWETESGAELAALEVHDAGIEGAALGPDGKLLLAWAPDGSCNLWSLQKRSELASLRGHQGPVRCAAFSPDGGRIVTGSTDGTARIWDPLSGNQLVTLRGHVRENERTAINAVSFSPDGTRIATGASDRTVILWDSIPEPVRAARRLGAERK
jgi:WD40 repeat protein/serine/threonine protein kinase